MYVFELCMDIYFWVDIVINFLTAYHEEGRVRASPIIRPRLCHRCQADGAL